jgi:hypothetical protein
MRRLGRQPDVPGHGSGECRPECRARPDRRRTARTRPAHDGTPQTRGARAHNRAPQEARVLDRADHALELGEGEAYTRTNPERRADAERADHRLARRHRSREDRRQAPDRVGGCLERVRTVEPPEPAAFAASIDAQPTARSRLSRQEVGGEPCVCAGSAAAAVVGRSPSRRMQGSGRRVVESSLERSRLNRCEDRSC